MTASPERILAAICERGVRSDDFRDAVHEAAHALDFHVEPPWTRDSVSQGAPEGKALKFRAECIARAVELTLCERHAVPYDLDKWLLIAAMEAIKIDGYSVEIESWRTGIRSWVGAEEVDKLCDKIESLAVSEVSEGQ